MNFTGCEIRSMAPVKNNVTSKFVKRKCPVFVYFERNNVINNHENFPTCSHTNGLNLA